MTALLAPRQLRRCRCSNMAVVLPRDLDGSRLTPADRQAALLELRRTLPPNVMFKLTLLVLLFSALATAHVGDIFEGCVQRGEETEHGQCAMAPTDGPGANVWKYYAERALAESDIQPDYGNLNTLLNLTRVATQMSNGITIRVEFTTTESSCKSSDDFSFEQCLPLGDEVNGLCQARFRYSGSLKPEVARCCPLAYFKAFKTFVIYNNEFCKHFVQGSRHVFKREMHT
ncbi:hypothetical protein HPB50_025276 [Hyalomma asiaticum]|uniref:Uncharacterized protein n=1 Tax=Hyalomma asiaticum TaxID=266040 RepID=A0ACB7RZB9_HYAAI|nr:hypothetical protein HPB50_025276 [Hyalomma asiaticum]